MKNHYIPEEQFPIKIDKHVYVLGNYFFNLFLIIGNKESALFEVGISAITDHVIKQLENLNIEPDFLISSHPHSDHITGLPGLSDRYPKARVIIAKGAKKFIEHPKAAPALFKEDAFMSKSLADLKIKPGRPPLEVIPNLDGSIVVEDKISMDLGSITLDLIKVKGHSPGNLIGILPEKKILFCSDSLGFHFPGRTFLPLFFTGSESYISTLNLIKKFNPSIICPAHQGPLKGKMAKLGIQKSIDITLETIRHINSSQLCDEELALKIFEQNYIDEFTLYTAENIKNCAALIVKRAKEANNL
jgi:glyoxylase-like metal-dependent hydrolase (beta-lactamase superfamily II)